MAFSGLLLGTYMTHVGEEANLFYEVIFKTFNNCIQFDSVCWSFLYIHLILFYTDQIFLSFSNCKLNKIVKNPYFHHLL